VLLERIDRAAAELDDPGSLARVYQARSERAMFAGDTGAHLESERAAASAFERAGDLRYACMQRGHVGYACLEIGAYPEAEHWLREVLGEASRMGLQNVVATAKHNLGRALRHRGSLDEALVVESEAAETFRAHGDRRLESAARVYIGNILQARGELELAEAEMLRALELAPGPLRPPVLANLASLLLARGRPDEALAAAREANLGLDALGSVEEGEALIRLVLAISLEATGDRPGACIALQRALDRVLERAASITDPHWRASFLEQVPESVQTLALAAQLGVAPTPRSR
jgi:tetratricopeptide (TPR) repeat protein